MHRTIGALSAAAVALAAAGLAQAQTPAPNDGGYSPFLEDQAWDPVGPYVGIAGGGQFMNSVSARNGESRDKAEFGGSYVGLGTIGWNFGNGFRAEVEGGYRRSDVTSKATGTAPGAASGALGMYTVMVNGLYDFDLAQYGVQTYGVVPHLGVGVGWAGARFDHAGYQDRFDLSGQESLFAYQGIAGFDYKIAPQVKLSLDYKYLGTDRGDFHLAQGLVGTRASASIQDQAVLLGVRYEFGEPPPPPAPMAPPPPPPVQPPPAPVAKAPEAQRAFQVFFDFNKSDLTAAARQVIKAAADTAQSGHFVHVVVTGHTDTVGSARYNQRLSERRAEAVKGELVVDGLPDGEITTLGVGKTGLLVPTADGVREAQNRRATIELGDNAGS